MNEFLYKLQLICARRGVALSKVESVAFNIFVDTTLATLVYFLPVVANTFYFLEHININTSVSFTGGLTLVVSPNSGQGSAGDPVILIEGSNVQFSFSGIETNSLQYQKGSFSAGNFRVTSQVFKVTYQ